MTGEAAGRPTLLVEVRYRAEQTLEVRPEAWFAVPLDGEAVIGRPASVDPALDPDTLEPGEIVTGWLEFNVAGDGSDLFLDYVGPDGVTLFIVALF